MSSTPRAEYEIATRDQFPHGLCCSECRREIPFGTPYKSHIVEAGDLSFVQTEDSTFEEIERAASITALVCVYC